MSFKGWLELVENATAPGARRGLYPDAYSAVFGYPSAAIMNWSADALVYMREKDKKLTFDNTYLRRCGFADL